MEECQAACAQTFGFVAGLRDRADQRAVGFLQQIVPEFPLDQGVDQAGPAIARGITFLVQRVKRRVLRDADLTACQTQAIFGAAQFVEGAHQPFFIVSVVVNLVGQDPVFDHVGVIHACACLLLPGGIVKAFELGKRVPRHVPHVGDPRCHLAVLCGGFQRARRLAAIPQMDAVVMRRMLWIGGKDLIHQRIHRLVARDRSFTIGLPDFPNQKRLGLHIPGMLLHDGFQIADVIQRALFFVALVVFVLFIKILQRRDPELLVGVCLGLEGYGFFGEFAGPLFIVHVRHRHAPKGHRAFLVQRRHLPEGPLRLIIPEPVELPHALVEELLGLGLLRGDRKIHLSTTRDQHRRLPRPFIESLTMLRVPGQTIMPLVSVQVDEAETEKEERVTKLHGRGATFNAATHTFLTVSDLSAHPNARHLWPIIAGLTA